VTLVSQHAEVGLESAERATRAVLQTLAERIAGGEARDLAERLPPQLAPWLATDEPAERFSMDEFIRRVAQRERHPDAAREHAGAVMQTCARRSATTSSPMSRRSSRVSTRLRRLAPR
jgi:uncharacterized protein (DUF2267 family)